MYYDSLEENSLLSVIEDNDIVAKPIGIGVEQVVAKVGPNEWAGLKVGDIINISDYREAFEPNNRKLQEGDIVKLRLKRDKEFVILDIKVKYGLKKKRHLLRWMVQH
jgi:methionine aminopeptidase